MICFMFLLTEWEGGKGLFFIWFSNQIACGTVRVIMIIVTVAQGIFKSILKRILLLIDYKVEYGWDFISHEFIYSLNYHSEFWEINLRGYCLP